MAIPRDLVRVYIQHKDGEVIEIQQCHVVDLTLNQSTIDVTSLGDSARCLMPTQITFDINIQGSGDIFKTFDDVLKKRRKMDEWQCDYCGIPNPRDNRWCDKCGAARSFIYD